jgi:2-hydroxy-6-oxonona-2,4-dienedioate hydrolase/4,5:9,10-diseco-3-hydroxy-5,9,17-trioxoandrosta-1(10),2-diene-4-oate hydrolase
MAGFAKSFRTVIVDLPGFGRSETPSIEGGHYTFHARVLAALIEEYGEQSAHVVGLATGGAIGIVMAAMHPEVVDRLVLVSSAGGLPTFSVHPSEGMKAIRTYYRGKGPSRDKMLSYLELVVHDHTTITDELVEGRYQASLENRAQDSAGVPESVWEKLPQIAAPTLVIWGRDNRVLGYDNALFMLNRIPDVEVHLFGDTGLWVPWERRERFEALVRDFLSSI